MGRLDGKVALISGGSRGQGAAEARLFVEEGAKVVVADVLDGAKRERALELGAAGAFDSAGDWPVKVDVVVETVGPATWEQSIRALKPAGRVVVAGGTSGPKVELNLPRLFFKQIEVIGSTTGSYEEFAQVTGLVAQGVPVRVDEAFDLADYPKALERLHAGAQLGKLVLTHPR